MFSLRARPDLLDRRFKRKARADGSPDWELAEVGTAS
jgi:hypothetical protein